MTIDLIVIGKTDMDEVASLFQLYSKRINRYVKFSIITLPDIKGNKKLSVQEQKQAEGRSIMAQIGSSDFIVLLDERGSEYRSTDFATWLEKKMVAGVKRLCFIIGGPYGFSQEIYERANESLAMSKMTFSHQIIRAIFAEQLYRAFAIINNEPYHNE